MRKLGVLVLIILFATASAVQADTYSRKVEVLSFEIRSGRIESGDNTLYVFEGDEYKIEATLRLPTVAGRKVILYTNLGGRIHVECQDFRPDPQFKSFNISEFAGKDIAIQVLGDPGYALESRGPRVISGEVKDFRFFRICVDGVETEILWQDQRTYTLTTEEIFKARQELTKVNQALSQLENSSTTDLAALKSIRTKTDQVRQMIALAEQCIVEGAPEEAIGLADLCMEILLSGVLEDQITFFNCFIDRIPVDKAKATDHSHRASTENIEAEKASNIDDYIAHANGALEELGKAEVSITDSICSALKWQKNFLAIAAIEFGIIVGLLILLLRRRKELTPGEVFGKGDY